MGFGIGALAGLDFAFFKCEIFSHYNENIEGFFQSHRGLRQGGRLSPLLFLIATEGLNHMFRITKTNGWIKDFSVKHAWEMSWKSPIQFIQMRPSYICAHRCSKFKHLREILTTFEGISGLYDNLQCLAHN